MGAGDVSDDGVFERAAVPAVDTVLVTESTAARPNSRGIAYWGQRV